MHRPDTGQRENVRKRPASPLHKPQPVCRGVRGIGLSSAGAVCLRRLLYSGTERQAGLWRRRPPAPARNAADGGMGRIARNSPALSLRFCPKTQFLLHLKKQDKMRLPVQKIWVKIRRNIGERKRKAGYH